MGQRPANPPMDYQEMLSMNRDRQAGRLHTGDSSAVVSTLIKNAAKELSSMGRISLNDTATIRQKTFEYLDACKETGVVPAKTGLARAFGVSRQAIDDFMKRNPTHETSLFLDVVLDAFVEVLTNSALYGGTNIIMSIFLSKAIYKLRDNTTLEIVNTSASDNDYSTPEQIARKYNTLPAD